MTGVGRLGTEGSAIPSQGRGKLSRFGWLILRLVGILSALVIVLWLIGRIFTDRFFWSQWLFWMPTPALLPIVLLGLIASRRPAPAPRIRRNRSRRWVICGALLLVYFAVVEQRLLHRGDAIKLERDTPGQLRIVHWNGQAPAAKPDEVINVLRMLDGDVMFLTDVNWATWLTLEREGPAVLGMRPYHFCALIVVSRLPVTNFRPLVGSPEMIFIVAVTIDATSLIGREVVVYFVDMPSDPRIPRAELMRRARFLLDQSTAPNPPPAPDLAVGDFNIPRGATSIAKLCPGMREAFDEAGHGYGATYPRELPIYPIDHMLLSDDLRALRYDLVDPGIGRHLAQVGWITTSDAK